MTTQLQQYQNILQNTIAQAVNIWDDAMTTMSNLRGAIDSLNYYKTQLGSLDAYLQKFGDLDAVLTGCSEKVQQVLEPSVATCEPQAMKIIISDLGDAQKESFIAACKSW